MSPWLGAAALLAFAIGLAHSILGERYVLGRLFRRGGLPRLFGGEEFTRRTLRFAWHITTLAWWGFAGQLALLAAAGPRPEAGLAGTLADVVAVVFLVSALVAGGASRGRHLSWVVFLAIALCIWAA